MKRTLVAVALVVVFVMALAAPALAQSSIMHTATYEMDGTINFEKQMGHLCNTGAEIKQTISGNGFMEKAQTVNMIQGKITMDDANDWVAGATALTVTTVWELCAAPKYTYDDGDYEGVVHPYALWGHGSSPRTWYPHQPIYRETDQMMALSPGWNFTTNPRDIADDAGYDAVSDQIWAVQVMADPGFSGALHQKGEAAEGKYAGFFPNFADPEDSWMNAEDRWRWERDEDGVLGLGVGDDFVGSYFSMDQHARTSMGTLRRYIDISSPFSHGYLMEDMSVVGRSDVQENFLMANAPKGADMEGTWWDLF